MPEEKVKTVFSAKDLMSKTFRGIGNAIDRFTQKSDKGFKKAEKSALSFKNIAGGVFAGGLISRGTALATQGIRSMVGEVVHFDDAITQAAAKYPEKIKRGTAEFEQLKRAARDVGANTKYSATEAAEGLNFLAMAGFNAKQSVALLPKMTDLATAGNMDFARATDIASDALGAFGLMTKDTTKLTENLGRVNDVIAKTVNMANLDMEQFFETMKHGGPVATAAGNSMEEFAAVTAGLASSGIKGSQAGTTLKKMFLSLNKPGREVKKIFRDIKLKVIDAKTKAMRPMIDILSDMEKGFKKMGSAQRNAAIETIFGERAVAGVSSLMVNGIDTIRGYKNQLDNAAGAAHEMAMEIEKSLGNKLLRLKSAAIEVGMKFFDAFANQMPGGIDAATAAVSNFDVTPVVEGAREAWNVTKDLASSAKDLVQFLGDMGLTVPMVVKGFVAYKVGAMALMKIRLARGLYQHAAAWAVSTKASWAAAAGAKAAAASFATVAAPILAGVAALGAWYLAYKQISETPGAKAAFKTLFEEGIPTKHEMPADYVPKNIKTKTAAGTGPGFSWAEGVGKKEAHQKVAPMSQKKVSPMSQIPGLYNMMENLQSEVGGKIQVYGPEGTKVENNKNTAVPMEYAGANP